MKTKDIYREDYEFYGDETGRPLTSSAHLSKFVYIRNKQSGRIHYIVLNTDEIFSSTRTERVLRIYNKPLKNEDEVLKDVKFKKRNGYFVHRNNIEGFNYKEYHYVMERIENFWRSVPIGDSKNPEIIHKKGSPEFDEFDYRVSVGEYILAEIEKEITEDEII